MKVAQVIATFPPYHGGMGYVCFHNARELARRGHEVTVFTLEHHRLGYGNDPKDFRIVRLATPLLYGDGGMVPQLYFLLKDFEIIHLHYPFFGGAEYVYLSSLLRGHPYFLTYHMDVYGSSFLKKMLIGVYEPLFMKKIIKKAAMIGALSLEHLKSSKAAPWVDWEDVVEMPNGVDIDRFQPREKDLHLVERYGLENKVVVLFVGNFQPFKGLPLLIDAIAKIRDDRVVALVVGGGYGEKQYKGMVREKGLGDRIISALPGPSRLIEQGRDGLIVRVGDSEDLKNKIEYLASERKMCREMGESGRQKALANYSWEKIGNRLEKTLRDILDKKGLTDRED
jgi:glycosyltransferase involved in cell wall biosynthesis